MKHSMIKWIGTIVIVVIAIYVAVNFTYRWQVKEQKAYRLNIPEYSFSLKDGRQLRITISLVFDNSKEAEEAAKRKTELSEQLVAFFKDIDSTVFGSNHDTEITKAKLTVELQKAGYPIEYVYFGAYPKIL